MLEFYFDCLDYYLDRSDFELVEVDTDSQYLALSQPIDKEKMDRNDLSYHPLMSMVKPDKLDEFKAMIYNRCHDDWEPLESIHFFPVNVAGLTTSRTRRGRACSKQKCGAAR